MSNGAGPDVDVLLERRTSAPHAARLAVRDLVGGDRYPSARHAELATSEVVTYALTRGAGPCRLRIWHTASSGWLRVEVEHTATQLPDPTDDHSHAEVGALGLAVLAEVPAVWGTEHSPFAETLWFEING